MEIKFRDGWIHHPGGQFSVDRPVVDARQIDDRIIVLFDYMAFPEGGPARNLFAYTLDGNVLWRADDIGCGTLDAYTNIISTTPLVVGNFSGFVCSIDASSGMVQVTCFTKYIFIVGLSWLKPAKSRPSIREDLKIKICMSNYTFACLYCKKLQRKDKNINAFHCPICGRESIRVHWKLHVPSPKKSKKWESFWNRYLHELRQIEDFKANKNIRELYLPLLNQRLSQ